MEELQNKVKEFSEENNFNSDPKVRVLDLISEVGEVAKEVLKMDNYGKGPFKFREEIKSELGDVLFVLILIANKYGVDLDEALKIVLEKYNKRLKKGSPGSE